MRIFSATPLVAALVLFVGFGLSTTAKADTVGSSASVNGGLVDGDPSDGYIINQAFTGIGYSVTSFSFYGFQSGNITPVLFTASDNPATQNTTFTVVGIGTERTGTGIGANQTFDFGLVSGTNVVAAGTNTYFGFFNTNGADVAYSNGPINSGGVFLIGNSNSIDAVGDTFQSDTFGLNDTGGESVREYSINATATPEPSTLSLLGLGLSSLGAMTRFRRR